MVPNDYVAGYVASHPEKLVGFASVDPARPDALDRLTHAVTVLGLRGLKVGPIYQHFDPTSPAGIALFSRAESLGIPVLCHQATTFIRDAPLRWARPILLDDVATACPDLVMCVAHLGHPWCEELMVVIRKHPHLYADVSALHARPIQLYFALASAVEYRVTDRLLLGSDYPFATTQQTIDALRRINDVVRGTGFPPIPDEVIEGIIGRDTLALLGIEDRPAQAGTGPRRAARYLTIKEQRDEDHRHRDHPGCRADQPGPHDRRRAGARTTARPSCWCGSTPTRD